MAGLSHASHESLGALETPVPRPLWSANFTFFFTARAIARLGDMMLPIALAVGLVHRGYGAGGVGLAMASFLACFAGFVAVGGVVADRLNPLRLMVSADAVRVLTQSLAAVLFISGTASLTAMCAIGAVNGIAAAFFQPGVASTIPRIAHDVQRANGAISTAESVMAIAGPVVAGVLAGAIGVGGVFAVHAGIYLCSATCLSLLRLPALRQGDRPSSPSGTRGFRTSVMEGWLEVRSRRWLWGVLLIWMLFMLTVWGPTVPLAATDLIIAHGEHAYSLVNAALGAGMAAGGLLAMRIRPRHPLRAGAVALFGFCLQPLSVGAGFPVAGIAAGCAVAGAAMAFWSVMWATSIQTQVAPEVLNRVHGYEVAGSVAMMPVGQALAGPVSASVGRHEVLLGSSVLSVVTCVILLAIPDIRRLVRVE